jgi:hypothetical protein
VKVNNRYTCLAFTNTLAYLTLSKQANIEVTDNERNTRVKMFHSYKHTSLFLLNLQKMTDKLEAVFIVVCNPSMNEL